MVKCGLIGRFLAADVVIMRREAVSVEGIMHVDVKTARDKAVDAGVVAERTDDNITQNWQDTPSVVSRIQASHLPAITIAPPETWTRCFALLRKHRWPLWRVQRLHMRQVPSFPLFSMCSLVWLCAFVDWRGCTLTIVRGLVCV